MRRRPTRTALNPMFRIACILLLFPPRLCLRRTSRYRASVHVVSQNKKGRPRRPRFPNLTLVSLRLPFPSPLFPRSPLLCGLCALCALCV